MWKVVASYNLASEPKGPKCTGTRWVEVGIWVSLEPYPIPFGFYYRPQTKFAKVMFLQVFAIHGEGGMLGEAEACMVKGGGHVWQRAACVAKVGHAW